MRSEYDEIEVLKEVGCVVCQSTTSSIQKVILADIVRVRGNTDKIMHAYLRKQVYVL